MEGNKMKWSVGVKIGSAFALVWLLLLAIGAASYRSMVQLIETAGMVEHTNQVRLELTALLSHLQDAETGQRGFVLTGVDRYLEPHAAGVSQTAASLQRLRQWTIPISSGASMPWNRSSTRNSRSWTPPSSCAEARVWMPR
jgi:CHASE3 domain sensor protein